MYLDDSVIKDITEEFENRNYIGDPNAYSKIVKNLKKKLCELDLVVKPGDASQSLLVSNKNLYGNTED